MSDYWDCFYEACNVVMMHVDFVKMHVVVIRNSTTLKSGYNKRTLSVKCAPESMYIYVAFTLSILAVR